MIEVEIPIRLVSGANAREHWRTRAARVKRERAATAYAIRAVCARRMRPPPHPLVVTLIRVAPRKLDLEDNLPASCKAVRDQVAAELGVSDAPGSGVEWRYAQERGRPRQYAVRVRIERAG